MHCYASWCKVPQRAPRKLLKDKEIQVTDLSEKPRVGAERGPPSADQLIPPLGTIFLDFQSIIRWAARGLIVALSIGRRIKPTAVNSVHPWPRSFDDIQVIMSVPNDPVPAIHLEL